MYPLTDRALRIVRSSHSFAARVEVWSDGQPVQVNNEDYGLPVLTGDISIDMASHVRRVLTMTTPASEAVFDLLTPGGVELRAFRGIRFPDGDMEWIPLGRFVVDDETIVYSEDGTISITAPDWWGQIQRAKFERIRVTSGNAVDTIIGLVREVLPDIEVVTTQTFTYKAIQSRWEWDRDDAIKQLASAASVDVCFDADGKLSIRPYPVLAGAQPMWRVDAGQSGIQLSAQRTRTRQGTYNVVIVRADSTDGNPPYYEQKAEDNDPDSPTFVGGSFGRAVYIHADPLMRTATQARLAARTMLDRLRALSAQVTLESVVNPALDVGDCIGVIMPAMPNATLRIERHLVEACNVPLTVDGTQTITTRSTGPSEVDDGGLPGGDLTWTDILTDDSGGGWQFVKSHYATWNNLLTGVRIL